MSSIITAQKGDETIVVEFPTFDVDESTTFTVTGDKDQTSLLEWLNWLTTIYGSNDGISGLYTDEETPRAIIKAFRLTGYAVTVPEIWEGMDDEEDQIGGETGAPGQDNY